MSQRSLSDFATASEPEAVDDAADGPTITVDDTTIDGAGHVRCVCGAAVSKDYARVMGDNQDRVTQCPECSSRGERARSTLNARQLGGGW